MVRFSLKMIEICFDRFYGRHKQRSKLLSKLPEFSVDKCDCRRFYRIVEHNFSGIKSEENSSNFARSIHKNRRSVEFFPFAHRTISLDESSLSISFLWSQLDFIGFRRRFDFKTIVEILFENVFVDNFPSKFRRSVFPSLDDFDRQLASAYRKSPPLARVRSKRKTKKCFLLTFVFRSFFKTFIDVRSEFFFFSFRFSRFYRVWEVQSPNRRSFARCWPRR